MFWQVVPNSAALQVFARRQPRLLATAVAETAVVGTEVDLESRFVEVGLLLWPEASVEARSRAEARAGRRRLACYPKIARNLHRRCFRVYPPLCLNRQV